VAQDITLRQHVGPCEASPACSPCPWRTATTFASRTSCATRKRFAGLGYYATAPPSTAASIGTGTDPSPATPTCPNTCAPASADLGADYRAGHFCTANSSVSASALARRRGFSASAPRRRGFAVSAPSDRRREFIASATARRTPWSPDGDRTCPPYRRK